VTRVVRCPLEGLAEGTLDLPRDASHYLTRVHRLAEGASFVVFDPDRGVEADARIVELQADRVRCSLGRVREAARVSKLGVTLIQSLGKGDRIEHVVRDTTQLGVQRIVLVETERSVVRWIGKGRDKLSRYRAVAIQACRQCGRGDAPALVGPLRLGEALELVSALPLKLCLELDAPESLYERLEGGRRPAELGALVGPEGGLSPAEVEAAHSAGFVGVTLGPFTLRTETAAVATLAILAQYG
jgi:16S rRNA (uracil1498-N3)-methyltransferase